MAYLSQRLGLTRYEADEYYALALDAYQKGKFDDAIDNVGFAITLLPLNSEYHAARGLFYLEDGVDDKAKASFDEALRLHDGEVLANYGLGVLAFRKQEWSTAARWFNKARAVNPTRPEIPYYLALIRHRQQDNHMAKTYMEQALQLMDDVGDKRKVQARRWVREFEKLLRLEKRQAPPAEAEATPTQQELPITGAESGVKVTPPELGAGRAVGTLGDGTANKPDEQSTTDAAV